MASSGGENSRLKRDFSESFGSGVTHRSPNGSKQKLGRKNSSQVLWQTLRCFSLYEPLLRAEVDCLYACRGIQSGGHWKVLSLANLSLRRSELHTASLNRPRLVLRLRSVLQVEGGTCQERRSATDSISSPIQISGRVGFDGIVLAPLLHVLGSVQLMLLGHTTQGRRGVYAVSGR